MFFIGRVLTKKKEESFYCSFVLAIYHHRSWEFPHLVMLLNLTEIFIYFLISPFLSTSFSERITWKCPVSPFSIFFVLQCQEGHFLGVVSNISRKVHRLETYWKYIRVVRSRRKNSQMPFIWNSYIIMIIGIGDHLKCYVIIKGLATNF